MKKVDKISFFEIIIFSIIFCLNYRKEHNGLKKNLNAHDVRECVQKLTGNDVNFQDIEKVTKTLITNGLIDENLTIQDETIENSLIQFNVKQNRSDNIINHYADRKRLIISVLKVLAYQKGNVSGLTIKEIQNELKKVSGVTVKQAEIKTVMDNRFEEIKSIDENINIDEEQQRIQNLVNLENVAEIGIWSLVTFAVICCLRRTPEYSEKKKILEENTVLRKIGELVDCSIESLYGFTFKDIKDELILNKLINSTLNIAVKDISRGEITINRRPLVGPMFANLDFISFLAFYVLYSLGRKPSNNYEIAEHIKRIVKEYSFDLFYHIDRKNIAFIIGFLYAQGLIDEKLKITVPDLRRFRFFINDIKKLKPDKIKIKELIIQDCLKRMGCDEGNGVDFGGEISLHESMADETGVKEHYPFNKPSFAKLDFVSFLAFYALYIKGRAPFKRDEILNKMKSVAKEHSFELTGIDKNASPLIFNYLYAQGIINNKKDIIVPDLGHFLFCINDMNMIESEKTSPKVMDIIRKKSGIIRQCLTKMGCDDGIIDESEVNPGAYSHYEDQTYYNDAGQIFHRFNSDELENHEWILIDCLQNRDYLKKIVGEQGRPLALKFLDGDRVFNEFKIGQEFLWECYNARTNETHKNYYRRLSFFVSKFIYENSLFLKELFGIREPIDVSKRLGINIPNAGTLRQESEEIDIIMNLIGPEFNKRVNEYLAECSYDDNQADIDEMLEDNRPLVIRMEGMTKTRKFIDLVHLIDNYDVSHETNRILKEFELGKDTEDFMPFVVDFRLYASTATSISKKEKKNIETENLNRKRALYVLLYSLYRFMKNNKE